MKCEIKLLNKTYREFIKDTITHPKQNAWMWFKCSLIAIPTVLINEVMTPKTDYICIGGLVVCVIGLFVALHYQCKKNK